MYLLAVKSFITRVEGAKVFAHSDGTLKEKDVSILKNHIPGITVISQQDARKRAEKEINTTLQRIRIYGGTFDRLIDSILWSEGLCHVQMDSDILTINHPDWIETWVKHGRKPFIIVDYMKEDLTKLPPQPNKKEHIQTQIERAKQTISKLMGMEFGNVLGLCSGLYGWQDQLKLNDIERFVTICESLNFDMQKWGAEQVTTTWLLDSSGAERLPADKYINLGEKTFPFLKSASMVHFIGTYRFRDGWYANAAKKEISRLINL
jgi:hypothetical protein